MSSPVVGAARVEITGDLAAFARDSEAKIDASMRTIGTEVQQGMDRAVRQADGAGGRLGDDFTDHATDSVRHGMDDVTDAVHDGLNDVTDDASRQGTRAGDGMAGGMRGRMQRGMAGLKESMKSQLGQMATAAVGLFAIDKVKDFFTDAIGEARESQKVGAQTEQVIKSTGMAAKVSADQVGDLAGAISAKSGIDDEAIQTGQNLLLTFTGIRNETGKGNDIFNQATQAMVDMSATMGVEAKGSAIQLGKALNDPVKGMTALAKVGVSFTAVQKATNKALVEGGDVNALNAMGYQVTTKMLQQQAKAYGGDMTKALAQYTNEMSASQRKQFAHLQEGGHVVEAQKNILKELSKEFGGQAASQATAGEKMSVAWGNFKETIGTAVLPLIDKFAGIMTNDLIPALSSAFGWMQENGSTVKALAIGIGVLAAALVVAKIGLAAYNLVTGIAAVLSGEQAAATSAQTLALGAQRIAMGIATAAQWALNAAMSANPIMLVVIAIAAVVAALVLAYNKVGWFRDFVQAAFHMVVSAGEAVGRFFTDTIPAAFRAMVGWLQRVWNNVVAFIKTWGPRALIFLAPFIGIPLLIYRNFGKITGWLRSVWNSATSGIRSFVSGAVGFIAGLPGRIAGLAGRMLNAGAQLMAGLWKGLRDAASKAGGIAADIAKTIVNTLVRGINTVLGLPWSFPKITIYNPVPGMDDFKIGGFTMLPAIPEWHEKGGRLGAGWNIVGERGPEAIYGGGGAAGSPIYSNPSTMHMAGQGLFGGGGEGGRMHPDDLAALAQIVWSRPAVFQVGARQLAMANNSGQMELERL